MIDYSQLGQTSKSVRWWTPDVRDREHERLFQTIQRIRDRDAPRREACLRRMRMYGNYSQWSTNSGYAPSLPRDRLRYNLVKQGVDTLLAQVTSSKPKATFLVDGGDWTLRQAAKAADQLVEAQMRDAGIYDGLARAWERDAEIIGTGVLYDYIDRDLLIPKCERVLPLELLVDDSDGRYGKPRCIYRQRVIDRGVLLGLYEDKAESIRKVEPFSPVGVDEWLMTDSTDTDLVYVVEAWHLPSSKSANDGRYVCAIKNDTLHSEQYDDNEFPFTPLRWEDAPIGYWGVGVVEQLESDQVELNRTLRRIQEAAGVAAGMWLMQKGSKLRAAQFTDVPGACVEHSGPPPNYITPNTVPMDLVQHADRIIARALQRLGISESFANAIKPVGLNSGEAQRVHSDIYSLRQVEHAQSYDSAHVALAKRFVKRNREIWDIVSGKDKDSDEYQDEFQKTGVYVEVKRGRRTVLKQLRWSEASLPENQYVLKAYPTSSLPSEPSGRAAMISDWIQAGLIDQQTAKQLQDLPDTRGAMELELADYDFALFCYETMVEDAEYVAPEPYQSLPMAFELIRRSYLRAVIDGVPEERLQLVRDHMDAIKQLIQKSAQPSLPTQVDAVNSAAVAPQPAPDMAGIDASTLQVAA